MPHCLILALLLFQNPSLDSASPQERQAAVEQLTVLAEPDATPRPGGAVNRDAQRETRPATTQALAAAMQKDFDDDVRALAARALGTLKAKDQVPTLTATLEDPQNREHRDVRMEIIRTLALIRDPAAGPALEKALRDPNKQIVLEAISAVGLVNDTAARPTLEEFFRNDKDNRIKSR